MIRTAICDDKANIRAYLSSLIQAQSHPCEIVEYASAADCLMVWCVTSFSNKQE